MKAMLIGSQSLKKSRLMLTILSVVALSWYYMAFLMTMNMEPVAKWNGVDIALLFMMWSIMMVGMMLPSAIPVVMLVNKINQRRLANQAPYVHSLYFVSGYVLAWVLYSLVATLVQWWLHHLAILTPMMVSGEVWFSSGLLFVAGVYQWLPIKQRCLTVCRAPLSFIMREWGEGIGNAIKLGFKHGQYCLGCCWFLMALLFVAGVMNLHWIVILTAVVLVEKLLPYGETFSRILGAGLILSAVGILVN